MTATTVMALVAMTATAAAAPNLTAVHGSQTDRARTAHVDGSVRAVAAAVVAAARDLLGDDRQDVALPLLPDSRLGEPCHQPAQSAVSLDITSPGPEPLRAALLDLPPPPFSVAR